MRKGEERQRDTETEPAKRHRQKATETESIVLHNTTPGRGGRGGDVEILHNTTIYTVMHEEDRGKTKKFTQEEGREKTEKD